MEERTAKLLFVVGMTFSFFVVLAIAIWLVDLPPSSAPARRPHLSHRAPVSPKQPASSPRSALRPGEAEPPAEKASASSASPVPGDSLAPPKASAPSGEIAPDPALMKELSLLESELKRQIDAYQKDLDAHIDALAQYLALLPAAEAAQALKGLDDRSTLRVLRRLSASKQREILARFAPRRARRLQHALRTAP